ncbi:MAG: hypothetical protein EPN38_12070 [Rhodanobacteraceae bacterium]|nr:MAG: hypothetical protein EPN38_12070 [Rhodanobacteraceae bacterium]
MTAGLALGVTGMGAFLPGAPDWPSLREVLLGHRDPDPVARAKPAAAILPAAERRRAPEGVLLAVEVAAQACAMAACAPAALPCVFASTHGEISITDYVCTTLANAPLDLSPTKFHNSVLNAPAGYWTIATGCTAASSAVSACHCSVGAGLLEAASIACSEATPVLFALEDVAAAGPLAAVLGTRTPFGMALVLTPATGGIRIRLEPCARPVDAPLPTIPPALHATAGNPSSTQALALLAALAAASPARLLLPLSSGLSLALEILP